MGIFMGALIVVALTVSFSVICEGTLCRSNMRTPHVHTPRVTIRLQKMLFIKPVVI